MEKKTNLAVTVNGKQRTVQPGLTLTGLVRGMGVEPAQVVVERNLAIVPAEELEKTVLMDGDSIEVIHFVGGG